MAVDEKLCEVKHDAVDQRFDVLRCDEHTELINKVFQRLDTFSEKFTRIYWALIGLLAAIIIDILRGVIVLKQVIK